MGKDRGRISLNEFGLINCEYIDYNPSFIEEDKVYVLKTGKKGLLVFLDKHQNVMGIDNVYDHKHGSVIHCITDSISEYDYPILINPFFRFSTRKIVELADRIEIHETNHGHSLEMIVNGEIVDDEDDSVYVRLLSLIKYLGEKIKKYNVEVYKNMVLGKKSKPVRLYIEELIESICDIINQNVNENECPTSYDISNLLSDDNIYGENLLLSNIIDLFLADMGLTITYVNGKKELSEQKKDDCLLMERAHDLLKLLDVSREEVEERNKIRRETGDIGYIDLYSWIYEAKNSQK